MKRYFWWLSLSDGVPFSNRSFLWEEPCISSKLELVPHSVKEECVFLWNLGFSHWLITYFWNSKEHVITQLCAKKCLRHLAKILLIHFQQQFYPGHCHVGSSAYLGITGCKARMHNGSQILLSWYITVWLKTMFDTLFHCIQTNCGLPIRESFSPR